MKLYIVKYFQIHAKFMLLLERIVYYLMLIGTALIDTRRSQAKSFTYLSIKTDRLNMKSK